MGMSSYPLYLSSIYCTCHDVSSTYCICHELCNLCTYARLQLEVLHQSSVVKIEFDADGCWHPLSNSKVTKFFYTTAHIAVKMIR